MRGEIRTALATIPADDLGRTHPWLSLSADISNGRPAVFRNLTLAGNPELPNQVQMLDGNVIRWKTKPSVPLGPKAVEAVDSGVSYDHCRIGRHSPQPMAPSSSVIFT